MNVVEKTVKFHYNGTPTKSGWYYCATTDKSGRTDSDVIFMIWHMTNGSAVEMKELFVG